jgi:hypothetical protein
MMIDFFFVNKNIYLIFEKKSSKYFCWRKIFLLTNILNLKKINIITFIDAFPSSGTACGHVCRYKRQSRGLVGVDGGQLCRHRGSQLRGPIMSGNFSRAHRHNAMQLPDRDGLWLRLPQRYKRVRIKNNTNKMHLLLQNEIHFVRKIQIRHIWCKQKTFCVGNRN